MSVDVSKYKVGLVLSLEDCGKCKIGGKQLRACKIRIGGTDGDYQEETNVVTVVTSAPNVRENSRVVVALSGTSVIGDDGELMPVTKATVGGVVSEGMLCDSKMLGWVGGAKGIAVNLPESYEVGCPPPTSKPRVNDVGADEEDSTQSSVPLPGLFEKKLSKEEKKKLAAERKAKKKAAKEGKDQEEIA
mmetsp:Transcript_17560/g.33303  ORF Transcript_17560/g.33303 Transcript_17560/m.33303 type:complete len:189 (-) Transcript_17560:48-614(-)